MGQTGDYCGPMSRKKEFIRRLKELLRTAGISQKEAAEQASIPYKWLRRVASDGLERPTKEAEERLSRLAAVLGVDDWKQLLGNRSEGTKVWTVRYTDHRDLARQLVDKLASLIGGVMRPNAEELFNRYWHNGTPAQRQHLRDFSQHNDIAEHEMFKLVNLLQAHIVDAGKVDEFMRCMDAVNVKGVEPGPQAQPPPEPTEQKPKSQATDQQAVPQTTFRSFGGKKKRKPRIKDALPPTSTQDDIDEEIAELMAEQAEATKRAESNARARR